MKLSDITAHPTHRSDILRNNGVGNSGQVDPSSEGAASIEARDAGDRVEISDDARSAQKDARKAEEIIFARKALGNVPSISEDRIQELTERIKSGYYQQDNVIDLVAKRAGGELATRL